MIKTSPREKEYRFCPTCKTKLARREIDREKLLSCPNCEFIFWNNPKPVVSLLILDDGKILMIQRANEPLKDYWVLPGGYICYEEKPEKAIIREVKEETNLDADLEDLIGVYQIDNDPRGNNIDIIYSGKGVGRIKLNQESRKYKFFDPQKLPKLIAYKHRQAITDWLERNK